MKTAIEVQEKPILFTGSMIQALQEGKSQTRRLSGLEEINYQLSDIDLYSKYIVRDKAYFGNGYGSKRFVVKCPYGFAGTQLWVRETWKPVGLDQDDGEWTIEYKTGEKNRIERMWPLEEDDKEIDLAERLAEEYQEKGYMPWKPSIFMPRGACRYLLDNQKLECERLQDITEDDARKEGVKHPGGNTAEEVFYPYSTAFKSLWNSLNMKPKKRKANEWVTEDHYVSYPWAMDDFTRAYGDKVRVVAGQMVYKDHWLYVIPNPFIWKISFGRVS